jgi:Amt family ammonium transporter
MLTAALGLVTADPAPTLDTGNTAWILASSALVLFMTPGLAFFYGGMVRTKSVLNMIMMSFSSLMLITILWILYGFSLSFGNSVGGGLFGNITDFWGMKNLFGPNASHAYLLSTGPSIPATAFVAFQGVFAIITVALISGSIADRAKFGPWLIFSGLWATICYFPVAHWVFAFNGYMSPKGGWIANRLGALDFAGGTAVHINAGAAALALAIVLGKRHGWPREPMRPHNLTLVMLGAGILWFGWFGFNAGSELAADTTASGVWINTLGATAAAMAGWLITEKIRDGHATSLGAASGMVAGLVAITPACGSVSALSALLIGLVVGAVCALAIGLKYKFGLDDSLDVVGVHFVGGWLGTLSIGLFGTTTVSPLGSLAKDGLFYGGGLSLLGKQAAAAAAVTGFSFIVAFVIGIALEKTIGFRISEEDEVTGIDQVEHAETGYDLSGGFGGSTHTSFGTEKAGVHA